MPDTVISSPALSNARVKRGNFSNVDIEEARRRARIRTLMPILRNILVVFLGTMTGLMALSQLGVEITDSAYVAISMRVMTRMGRKVYDTIIPRNVRVSEAPSYSQSVLTYDPASPGALAYREAAAEVVILDGSST